MDREYDPHLSDEIHFLKERVNVLQEIIDSQRTLLAAYDDYSDQLKEEINELLSNP